MPVVDLRMRLLGIGFMCTSYIRVIFDTVSFRPIQKQILYVAIFAHNNVTFLFQPRQETNPRHGRLDMANRLPGKTDFFNVYSSHSSKRESNSFQVIRRKESSDEGLAVLQTPYGSDADYKQWDEGQDQRVPFNMTASCSAAGKENRRFHVSGEGRSSSKFSLQKERLSNSGNKRSTPQILALFSSHKNTSKMTFDRQTVEINESKSCVMKEKQLCNLYETADQFTSHVDSAKVIPQTTNVNAFQPSILDNDSLGQILETSEDLGDSLNLSPDSFATCSSENFSCKFLGGDAMCEDATQESVFTKSPDNDQKQGKVWSQNDSESVSPLIRLLTSAENADLQGCIDVNEDGGQLCKNMMRENRLLDHCSFESAASAAAGSPSSLSDPPPSQNVYPIEQYSYSVQKSALEKASNSDFLQTISLSEGNMSSLRPASISPMATAKDDVSPNYENLLPSQPKQDCFSVNPKGFSSHPGSLFPYSKLQSQGQKNHLRNSSDSSLFRKGFTGFDQWDPSFEHQAIDDDEGNVQHYEMSPEFYPNETEKTSEWRVAPIVATKVIPTDNRTVSIIVYLWITMDNYGENLFACNPISIGHTRYSRV